MGGNVLSGGVAVRGVLGALGVTVVASCDTRGGSSFGGGLSTIWSGQVGGEVKVLVARPVATDAVEARVEK
jgi:hypothetical protein